MASVENLISADNIWMVDMLYTKYLQDKQSVDASWQRFFEQFDNAHASYTYQPPVQTLFRPLQEAQPAVRSAASDALQIWQLEHAYRSHGHLAALINPFDQALGDHKTDARQKHLASLDAATYGLSENDSHVHAMIARLQKAYCSHVAVQYMHIDDADVTTWLQQHWENGQYEVALDSAAKIRVLQKLTEAELFEAFVHKKFLGAKRFSLEGGEAFIPLLDATIDYAAELGVSHVVIGMAHRGRLNTLTNITGKKPQQIFREFADSDDTTSKNGRDDVKYHLGFDNNITTHHNKTVHVSMCFNPSHLEFVGPVAQGRARALQDKGMRVLPIVVHGDAACSGQGIVQEMLNMSQLQGYTCGGTLHIVINNQVGFTTSPDSGRSSTYATDVAKMLDIPIFHVNGDDPEALLRVMRIAMDFRAAFGRDVVIDMYCYRRYGHNEGDEPMFTQPLMYQWINKHQTVRALYAESLVANQDITQAAVDAMAIATNHYLEEELAAAVAPLTAVVTTASKAAPVAVVTHIDNSVALRLLKDVTTVPSTFSPHPKIARMLEQRLQMASSDRGLDWGAGEMLAFASLVDAAVPLRLSGQDAGRGTFSHRHAVLHDCQDAALYSPLAALAKNVPVGIWDSPLSESAVLAFDYGYSLDTPEALVIWEAQFGDFANGAQVIIDQFLTSGEKKWHRQSGMVLLLPHGYEGQGPEHSSARLERFLAAASEDNIYVANPTTPAQLFHLLRRQIYGRVLKPLIVMSPKSLLRHPQAVSPLADFTTGQFMPILPEASIAEHAATARRMLLCSGKIYYDLLAEKQSRNCSDVHIIRLEQIYPLHQDDLCAALGGYPVGLPVYWVQEEPENMGAWPFLQQALGAQVVNKWPLRVIARRASASPATGSSTKHKAEQRLLLTTAFAENI